MSKFKVGDLVTCVRDEYQGMFKGSILKVSECGTDFVMFGSTAMYNPSLFEVVKVMKHDFKVGDWVKKETWTDFYEVVAVIPNKIQVAVIRGIAWYDVTECVFIKKEETMKLEVGGKYRKVGTHEPVRVICTDRVSSDVAKEFTCVSLVRNNEDFEYMSLTTAEGKDLLGEILFEEVPEVDWSKVPVDTQIWIVDGKNVHKRHFNKFENDYVHHWPDGKISFTAGCGHFSYRNKPEYCYLENPKV